VVESNSGTTLTSTPPISGAQLRAARALLHWSVRQLAHKCGLSQSAISRSERFNGTPAMRIRNLIIIRRLFEENGIEFLGLDGVRLPGILPSD
jgi:transcriptional regulator with XRE-family HTH domain